MPNNGPAGAPPPLAIATIGRPHGLAGEVTLYAFNPDGDALERLTPPVAVELVVGAKRRPATLTALRPTGKAWLARFDGVRDRDAAAALTKSEMHVDRALLPDLDDDQFYIGDLVGCQVHDQAGTLIGTARATFWNGAHDVLTVERVGGGELMLPIVPEFVVDFDAEARRIVVTPWDSDDGGAPVK